MNKRSTIFKYRVHFANSSPTRVPAADQQHTPMHDIPEHFTPQDHDMLRVSPQEFLKFTRGDSKESTLELSSTNQYAVTYKIQTTSPEKFRVSPRSGILNPGESISVNILLKPEHNLSENSKDKFLIMCLPAVDIQTSQIVDFWKKQGNNAANVEQHRLCCVYKDASVGVGSSGTAIISNGYSASSGDKKMESSVKASDETRKLEKQLRNTQILQIVTLAFLVLLSIAVIYLLKLQLCNDEGCFTKADDTANTVDFATCAKGKADL